MKKRKLIKIMSALLVFMLAFGLNININKDMGWTGPSSNKHFIQVGLKKVRADYNGEIPYEKTIDGIGYIIQEFKQSGTFTVPDGVTKVDITVVGGGGGGDYGYDQPSGDYRGLGGGGGGAGYVVNRYDVNVHPNNNDISIVIGDGGIGGNKNVSIRAEDGNVSKFGSITANGGKAGNDTKGGAGGSGGGAGGNLRGGCGGGGNGSNGLGNSSYAGMEGGTGQGTTTRGVDGILYAGGGGGGGGCTGGDDIKWYSAGAGGEGGGGSGSPSDRTPAKNGIANTGGGGGGGAGYYGGSIGGKGGSGIVIIRYLANASPILILTSPTSNSPLQYISNSNMGVVYL